MASLTEKQKKNYPRKIGGLFKLSFGEELANTISHGVPAILLILALPYFAVIGYIKSGPVLALGYSVFIICLFLMFSSSALYHAMDFGSKHKQVFRIIDHIMIYFAIAGTFTPICLSVIEGPLGIFVLVCQWIMVLFGILYKSISKKKMPKASVIIYLVMGWSAILLIPSLIGSQNWPLITLIVIGGLLYSGGVYFYTQKAKPFHHFIWHLFILLASISHFIGITFFIN